MLHPTSSPRNTSMADISSNGKGLRIAIVISRFNEAIGEHLLAATGKALIEHGVLEKNIPVIRVPGALEIPLALKTLAVTKRFDALIALGSIVRGETYHFEIVANESAAGITAVQLDTGVPIANGILTTENDAQAFARVEQKGLDCAMAAIEMARLLAEIRSGEM
ncbi:MAG: 6,7-dimethyl-8-ribityllumazine synthase [Ferrovum sp. 37-45-19]|nr:6,7-dimethyl-8-ribityllumazine synthase [Ferrovum sp. JA12]OYV79842.1 MAG: 6,7-dimethyl-8-ribityllumazine synthase [Ferrovum sp. 21-44-67]OYV95466.1 MAG: 6,7-dimethyl-8-ribityllumazine synthase [Ferrovum sp. 37-45-19]